MHMIGGKSEEVTRLVSSVERSLQNCNADCSVKNIFVFRSFLFVFPVNRKNDVVLPAFAEKVSCF